MLALQAEHFGNPRARGNVSFDDQEIGFFQTCEYPRCLLKGENAALVLMALLPQFAPADRGPLAFLPQPESLGLVVNPPHDGAHAVHRPPGMEGGVQPPRPPWVGSGSVATRPTWGRCTRVDKTLPSCGWALQI